MPYTLEAPASPYTLEPPPAAAAKYTLEPSVAAKAPPPPPPPPPPPLPFEDKPGETRGTFVPFKDIPGEKRRSEREPQKTELAVPEIIAGPLREMTKAGQVITGKRPQSDLSPEEMVDLATLGVGGAAVGRSAAKAAKGAEKLAPKAEAAPLEAAPSVKPPMEPVIPPAPEKAPTAAPAQPAAMKLGAPGERPSVSPKPPVPPKEPPESIPPGPGDPPVAEIKGFVRDTEDRLYQLQKSGTADKAELGNTLKALPPAAKDVARQERIYHAIEAKAVDKLTPEDRAVYDQHVKPINDEEDRLYAKLKNAGVAVPREGYVHRMVQGKQPRYDPRDPGATEDVITGGGRLSRTASALRDRTYLALDDGQGGRRLIATNKQGTSVYEGGKARPLGERLAKLQAGDEVTLDGKTYHVDQATTREIEANTETRYYKNALVNSVDNVLALRRVERAVDFLDSFKQDNRFLAHAERANGNAPPTPGYVATKLPQLEGWRMDPKIAHALDDFYGSREAGWEWLAKANRFLTTSMFVDPVPHLHNVATHWYVARGWDNIMPQTWKRSATNAARAVTQVITQGKEYQQFLREGGGLLYGDVANRNFYELMLKTMGQQIVKDPQRWGPIIKTLGFNRPADLVAALYRASSKALWAGNDMFMLQRYYDLIDKGMSPKAAIADAERHIPNYRIPSEVRGNRGVSVFLRQPLIFNFGRYRYGQLKSFAHMVKDLVKNDKPGARLEAIGNLMSLGVLAIFVYPFADKALQALTGNSETKARRAGPLGPVQNLTDVTTGEKSFTQALQSLIVPAPASEGILESAMNRNLFTGKPVLEPADQKRFAAAVEAGDMGAIGKYGRRLLTQALQEVDTKLYPAQLLEQAIKDEQPDGVRRLVERLLDVQEKSAKQAAGKAKGQRIERREAERRARSTERNLGIPQQ